MRRVPSHLNGLVAEVAAGETHTRHFHRDAPKVGARPPEVQEPHDAGLLERIVQTTPSRIATGRAGTRFRSGLFLELRADQAVAKDAVYAELPEDLATRLGCIEVRSRAKDREHYLLHPNEGRRLDDASRTKLESEGTRAADVQIIVADGLSSPALALSGGELLPALTAALTQRGRSVGRPILARLARVGLQDDIGVLLAARATIICLGERPGLGTGDSLSIYLGVAPRLDQDNSEKNCISNIRPAGLDAKRAAEQAADLVHRGLELGRSGLELV